MSGRGLSFLSWNLALLVRSAQAPLYWDAGNSEAIVRDTVLGLAPDIVLYQELPGLVPFVETHSLVPANPRSHSGHLATLVNQELATTELRINTVDGCGLLTTFVALDLTIANVHLAPGKGADADRLMQMVQVIKASPTERLLIVGDTNMRVSEAETLHDFGFVGDKPPHATWDSRRNRFRTVGPEFHAYFTRWFASPGVRVDQVTVHRDPVEHSGHEFFLSDHYALSGVIHLD